MQSAAKVLHIVLGRSLHKPVKFAAKVVRGLANANFLQVEGPDTLDQVRPVARGEAANIAESKGLDTGTNLDGGGNRDIETDASKKRHAGTKVEADRTVELLEAHMCQVRDTI